MESILKVVISAVLSLITALSSFLATPPMGDALDPINPPTDIGVRDFDFLKYPDEAVKTLEDNGINLETFKNRATEGDGEYGEARGHEDANGVIISPYYSLKINGHSVPVYSTVTFVGDTETGELHSFSEIYIDEITELPLEITLSSEDYKIKSALCLPDSLKVVSHMNDNTLTAFIKSTGTYTFVLNKSQEAAFTLFVKDRLDEDATIENLKATYGKENVTVYDSGVHYLDYINVTKDNSVIYLRQGAYLVANHKYEINSLEDEALYVENEALSSNALGLTRMPFVNFGNCSNVRFYGRGIIDMTRLDRRERRGMVFTNCNNVEVIGPKIINSPEWSFIAYNCENVNVVDLDILGYRINSDGFAICSSRNVNVSRSFVRTGDDLFGVKGLGGYDGIKCQNVTFSECYGWGGKARCFGIFGEVHSPISDITFKDSAVIYRDATWDNDRVCSLGIIVEQAGGSISNVTYDNIEIYKDTGRAIGCLIYSDDIENFVVDNIQYKNIKYNAELPAKFTSNGKQNTINATIENVTANEEKLTSNNIIKDEFANVTFRN